MTWVMVAGGVLPASADPDAIPPDLLAEGTVVSSELRFFPADEVGATVDTGARGGPRPTLEQLRQRDRDATATYRSDYGPPQVTAQAWSPPPFEYDYITAPYECHERSDIAGSADGWIKNHYAFCRIMKGEKVDQVCVRGICFPVTSTFRVTILGFGSERDRAVRFVTFVDQIVSNTPELKQATFLKLDLECTALLNGDECTPDPAYQTEVEKSLAEWERVPAYATRFTSTAPALTPENPNRLGYMDFWSRATARVVGLDGSKPQTKDSPPQTVRYDTVNYLNLNGNNGAIFSRVKAVIHFPVSRPEFAAMTESAAHYRLAMQSPHLTIPRIAGKTIPGAVDGESLTRWYFNNTNQNRAEAVKACIAEWGAGYAENGRYQCDEYPFNATHQGAARGDGRFSVARIPGPDNEAAGRWLGAWYSYDRILDSDAFHVDATP
ncbi:NucA/NucB deoxyribonuclease domain-containing protein [Saccharothrix hoggarensis]|uniref:Deoxyribonuclease NucA/NucB domain-containing protein n=1 Tax=Saccharothrix hoggarensis TaxID=913853 RepID=A0ABW3QTC5_9PSEU